MRRLAAIRDLYDGGAGIHVCGEAYSDYHGFIEGALRSATYAAAPDPEEIPVPAGASSGCRRLLPTLQTVEAQRTYFDSLVAWAANLDDINLAKERIFDPELEKKP